MTPRRAAAIGAAAGILPGLYLGLRAVQAELLLRQVDRSSRTLMRLLRSELRRRELEGDGPARYHDLLVHLATTPAT